jgi:hypothetical protein
MAATGAQDSDDNLHCFNDGLCGDCGCAWPCVRADLTALAYALGLEYVLTVMPTPRPDVRA